MWRATPQLLSMTAHAQLGVRCSAVSPRRTSPILLLVQLIAIQGLLVSGRKREGGRRSLLQLVAS
eukprot:365082-Chlamydomonas_euryale.AAC.3